MKAIQFGGIGLALAIVVAALGISFFRTVDGSNLRSLIRDNLALAQAISSLKLEQQTLLNTMASERTSQQEELARSLRLAGRLIHPIPQSGYQTSLGRSLHEE